MLRALVVVHAALLSDPRRPRIPREGASLLALAPVDLWEARGDEQAWASSCPARSHTIWHHGSDDPHDRTQTVADWAQRHVDGLGPRERDGVHHDALIWVDVDHAVDEPLLRAELPVPVLALAWPLGEDADAIVPAALDALRALSIVA